MLYVNELLCKRHYRVAFINMFIIFLFSSVLIIGNSTKHIGRAAITTGPDINGDGSVTINDLSIMLTKWGTTDNPSDLNNDTKVNIFDLSILLSAWGQAYATTTMSAPPGYTTSQKTFDDKFTGTSLNASNWNTYMTSRQANGWPWFDSIGGPGTSAVGINGFGDAYYSPAQVSVNNGLRLTLVPDTTVSGFGYRSGVITSYGHFQFNSGYVQIKARLPDTTNGQWPSMWFLPGPGGAGPDQGEIDLIEGGFKPTDVGLPAGTPQNQVFASHYFPVTGPTEVAAYNTGVDMSAGYHVYGMEYKPGQYVKTYFDGHLVGNFTNSINTDPYEIILNFQEADSSACCWRTTGVPPNPDIYSIAEVQVYQ